MIVRQKISPCLWFDTQAAAAAQFYVSAFPGSQVLTTTYYTDAGPMPGGAVMTVLFELCGQQFTALNGGPVYQFSPACSLVVLCDNQIELDRIWAALSAGGTEQQCGWLTDRFGLSWQILPGDLERMLRDPEPERSQRVMEAVLGMVKLDFAVLRDAYEGTEG